ncbi:hypothetical protein VTL71DRAFT_13366 [Oculimacula yallundae]|uniref:Uncharacterized protein n=1 Tax=Oculimacula yallundae TaxID=86028 RepID=A0ABR4CK58_9HELO
MPEHRSHVRLEYPNKQIHFPFIQKPPSSKRLVLVRQEIHHIAPTTRHFRDKSLTPVSPIFQIFAPR